MTKLFSIFVVAFFIMGISSNPSRIPRQFDWSDNFDDFDNDRNNQQVPDNNLNDAIRRPTNQLQEQQLFRQMEATSPAVTSTTTGTTTTRAPVIFTRCTNSCLSTQEYNPVCGTDGVTYNNPGRLRCAAACGANVQLSRGGACQPL